MFLRRLSKTLVGITLLCTAWGAGVQGAPLEKKENITNEVGLYAPLEFNMVAEPHNPTCYLDENGYFTISILNPDSLDYTYEVWKVGGSSPVDSGHRNTAIFSTNTKLSDGTYIIYVKETSTGLQKSTNQSLTWPSKISLSGTVTQPICSTGTGEIRLTASGGNGGIKYYLNYGQPGEINNGTGVFTSLPEGNYSAIVLDSKNCSGTYEGTPLAIAVPDPIDLSFVVLQEITCYNSTATVQINGVPADATITLKNNRTGNTNYSRTGNIYSGLDYGNYTISAIRAACPSDNQDKTFDIEEFQTVSMTTNPASPLAVKCADEKAGFSVTVSGGKASSRVMLVLENTAKQFSLSSSYINYNDTWTFSDIPIGKYTLKWVDEKNSSCTQSMTYEISGPSSALAFLGNPTGTKALCNGQQGSIQVAVTGGKSPYTYMINEVAESDPANIKRLAGTYDVYVVDNNNCKTETRTVTISEPEIFTVLENPIPHTNISCPGGSDGAINLSFVGGNGGYKYSMTGTETRTSKSADSLIFSVTNLKAGTYNFTFTDKNGCTANPINGIALTEPNPIVIDQFNVEPIKCFGETTFLNVKAGDGASDTYTYKLLLGSNEIETQSGTGTKTFENLSNGTYTLEISSGENCPEKDTTFTIEARKELSVINFPDSIKVRCYGDAGSFKLRVLGESPFRYSLNGGAPSAEFKDSITVSGLVASVTGNTHTITIYDHYDCQKIVSLKVYSPREMDYKNFQRTQVLCKGDNTGAVKFFMYGGTPGYTASLGTRTAKSNDTIRFDHLLAGNHVIYVNDFNGCPLSSPVEFEIAEPDEAFNITGITSTPVLCNGESSSMVVTVAGGWPGTDTVTVIGNDVRLSSYTNYTYTLKAGDYIIKATNQHGCTISKDYKIEEPKQLILTITDSTSVSCHGADDAKITGVVSGGTSPYRYGLSGSSSATIDFTGNSFTKEGGLSKGTYQVAVRDANNCFSNVVPVTIKEPTPVEFTVEQVDSVVCFGESSGRMLIAAEGGDGVYTYVLTYPNGTQKTQTNNREFRDLPYGTYSIFVKDGKNCEALVNNIEEKVEQPHEIEIFTPEVLDSISCADSTNARIKINATGGDEYGLQYSITGRAFQEAPIIENVGPGRFQVFVRDGRGKCQKTWSEEVVLFEPKRLTATYQVTNVKCYDEQNGSVIITPNGGTGEKHYWLYTSSGNLITDNLAGKFFNLGNFNADPSKETSIAYQFQVVDENKCVYKGNFTVTNPAVLTIEALDHHQVKCNGEDNGWINVEVKGGNGGYTFKRHFTDDATVNVETLSSTTYKISGYKGGDYQPMVIDSKQCSDTVSASVNIVDPPKLEIVSIEKHPKRCSTSTDDSTIVHAIGGTGKLSYSLKYTSYFNEIKDNEWHDSIFVNETSGLKRPWVKDEEGCYDNDAEFYLDVPEPFTIQYKLNGISCYGSDDGQLEMMIKGGTGPYYFSVDDKNYTAPIEIRKDTTNVYTHYIQGGIRDSLKYTFYMKDKNNCPLLVQNVNTIYEPFFTLSDSVLKEPPKLVFDSVVPYPVNCSGQKEGQIRFVAFGGTEPIYYSVENTESHEVKTSNNEKIIMKLKEGEYYCTIIDDNGCIGYTRSDESILTTNIIANNDSLVISLVDILKPACDRSPKGQITIKVEDFSLDGFRYWLTDSDSTGNNPRMQDFSEYISSSDADGFVVVKDNNLYFKTYVIPKWVSIGNYEVLVKDSATGCPYSIPVTVESVKGENCDSIVYYNVITPNGDGLNDYWEPDNMAEWGDFELKIYSSYGELVYLKEGPVYEDFKWPGTDRNDRPLPSGTYLWINKVGGRYEKGTITIIRSSAGK